MRPKQLSFNRQVKWWGVHLERVPLACAGTDSQEGHNPIQFSILPVRKPLSPRKLGSQEKAVVPGRRETPCWTGHSELGSPLLYSLERPERVSSSYQLEHEGRASAHHDDCDRPALHRAHSLPSLMNFHLQFFQVDDALHQWALSGWQV